MLAALVPCAKTRLEHSVINAAARRPRHGRRDMDAYLSTQARFRWSDNRGLFEGPTICLDQHDVNVMARSCHIHRNELCHG